MSKFEQDVKHLLTHVGGKENIKAVTHCVTRMRFVLIDPNQADIKQIEALPSVKGTFTQSGQFQVIIGNDVADFYKEFVEASGIEGMDKSALKDVAKDNQTPLQKLMSNIAEIFAPLIPALVCGGLILGFRNVIGDIKMFEDGTKTLAEINQFWGGLHHFLWLIGEAIFHFLPVGIVWSITKKMGTTQILGIILGLTLVSPQLLNAYAVSSTAAADIPIWDFGFTQIQMIGYQAQVIPAIMAGFVLVYLERFFTKVIPDVIRLVLVPFLALLPAVLVAHVLLGPIGWTIGDFISNVVYGGLTSAFGWLFAGVFGFLYAPLVITGLHHMTNAIDLQLMGQFDGTILWPMIALSNIAQGSAVMAMVYLQRKNENAKQIAIPSAISCYLGVTEPAMFGVNIKYGFPFISAMIGSAIAAVISVGSGVMANSIGVGGLPGFLAIQSQHWLMFFVAMAVAIVVPFGLTLVFGKRKLTITDLEGEQSDRVAFITPMEGRVMELSEVDDKVFSQGLMGEGFAIELSNGKIVAPFSGEVSVAFPTKHAYGIKRSDGTEILIHIGMDTVELDGKGFTSHVKVGDYVKQGDLIAEVDIQYIQNEQKSLVSPVVFTSKEKIAIKNKTENIQFKQEVVTIR
ncbi:PTS system trehalose-specific IIC component [Breznakia sp. PF5-3]|uniref:PTS system trehalose-specific EIIBC component n=1 Tax=unclassified Breznakia TaxID=2623764 RepID=UPI002404BE8F|nr:MULTISPECIES: PTS system trehalose-specific EIIBC component [unclassified Breznakia]MDF9824364.1 PTS system trehalose-specific IIC component [Breznakia sp. PM6-1]MDF9835045.1 PTS system trehalose-specific IIC component [Breznakia sp. PF5-3]MDF9837784.1 PTS system trehalose-specific IIC component [Breznakia sp. PFB2-8]MDF9859663.1 PTS system trehalose-specific IIC component [Breznakia sp. PH5-24]